MKVKTLLLGLFLFVINTNLFADVPPLTGKPVIVTPNDLLDWPQDFPQATPFLTEPTANRLNDLHGVVSNCDIMLTTAGNYHMALREIWQSYLKNYVADLGIKTWLYTTSPPISVDHVKNKIVQLGNVEVQCLPQVAVAPAKELEKIIEAGLTDGKPIPIIKNRGSAILVKKGNPKNIKSIWDLGRDDVTLVTPHPTMETGSFNNFYATIYNIAAQDTHPPADMKAEALVDRIFNAEQGDCGREGKPCHWVTGKRIMHREIPWAINAGKADAGVIFYHLALYMTRTFPDKFDIVPLGGTAEDPQPVKGNQVGNMVAVRIKGNWNKTQLKARERLIDALTSDEFTAVLQRHGLQRP